MSVETGIEVETSESISMHFAVGVVRTIEAFAVLLLAPLIGYFIFNRKKNSLLHCHF